MTHPRTAYQAGSYGTIITLHFRTHRAAEIAEIALTLGVPRHKLIITALNLGLEAAIAGFQAEQAAQQSPAAVKE